MEYSKKKQLGKYKKPSPPKEGSKTEAPVQAALDMYGEMKNLDSIRIPDILWSWVHNPRNKVPDWVKKLLSKALAGWPDRTFFIPITDKYCLACLVEAKSRTGGFSSSKQKNMAKRLKYQIPRSPDETIVIIDEFIKEAKKIRELLEEE